MADKVIDIEGVGPKYAELLAGQGIANTDQLLAAAASPGDREKLAAALDVSTKLVLEWANRADLMRINGVGSEYSDLLEAGGVDTVKELATRRPDNLHARLTEVNEAKSLVRRVPSLTEVEGWVAEAKSLPAILTY